MRMSKGFWKLAERLERLAPQVTSSHLHGLWQTPTHSHPSRAQSLRVWVGVGVSLGKDVVGRGSLGPLLSWW